MDKDYQWGFDTEEEWDAKFKEWEKREWMSWLETHLTFPFEAIYVEGDGKKVRVLELVDFDPGDLYGVIVEARQERRTLDLPLCGLEVTPETDPNYGPVKEFAVYWANR
jgi:hypothetical protein